MSDILLETNRNAEDLNIIFLRHVSANSIGSNVFQSNHLLALCSDKNIFPSSGEDIDEVGGVHVVDCTHEASNCLTRSILKFLGAKAPLQIARLSKSVSHKKVSKQQYPPRDN